MFRVLPLLAVALSALLKSRATLPLENLAVRHQIGVFQRSAKKRPTLTAADRFLWAWWSGVWADWRSALVIVKPETVIAWHRKGFRLFWTWKVRRGQPGRPPVFKETHDPIRWMGRENPIWGAPRIHGELLKLGIDVGETSVSKCMVCHQDVGSQNTSRVDPAPTAPWLFSGSQFLVITRSWTRYPVREEPFLAAQAGQAAPSTH